MRLPLQIRFAAIAIASSLIASASGMYVPLPGSQEHSPELKTESTVAPKDIPATVEEARSRAILLHATIHGVLQVMHRDFFDPDDQKRIPSASLEDVFEDLAKNQGIELRWLGVNAMTMNSDHDPCDDFERNAVTALSSGEKEFESVEDNRYRRVGAVVLHNVCLKCHVPNRTSLEDRAAGLVIAMPFGKK